MAPPRKVKIQKVGRRLESAFSQQIRKDLAGLGILSYKVSDRFHAGIPDIYIPSGIWIESKVIPRLPTKMTTPLAYLSAPQKNVNNALLEAGDEVLIACWYEIDGINRAFTLIPWWEFYRISTWDLDTIAALGTIIPLQAKADLKLERFFSKDCPSKLDTKIWWDDAFKNWADKFPYKFDANARAGKPPADWYWDRDGELSEDPTE